jgi:hypothetical protein
MTVLITLTVAGTDSGPFNLYSNLDGYTSAFESGVSRAALLAGYASALVPDFTTIVRVQSVGDCNNHIDIQLYAISTTSTSTSSTSSTTTTSTTVANTCYEFESDPYTTTFSAQYIDCNGVVQTANDTCLSPPCTYTLCGFAVLSSSLPINTVGVCGTTTTTTTSTPTTTTTSSSSSSTTTSTTTIVGPTTTTTTTPVTIL